MGRRTIGSSRQLWLWVRVAISVTVIKASLACGTLCNQWVSAGVALPDTHDGVPDPGPGRLLRRKLLPEIGHELGELAVGQGIPEGRHIAEIARNGTGDAVQDHLDQVVGGSRMHVAVKGGGGPGLWRRWVGGFGFQGWRPKRPGPVSRPPFR